MPTNWVLYKIGLYFFPPWCPIPEYHHASSVPRLWTLLWMYKYNIYIYILCTHIMYILFTKCYKLQILHILLFTNNNLYYIINSHIFLWWMCKWYSIKNNYDQNRSCWTTSFNPSSRPSGRDDFTRFLWDHLARYFCKVPSGYLT